MNKSQPISVGLFFILGVALLWIVHVNLSSRNSEKGYEIIAHFDNLLQLRAGDDVRMAGVRIGSVSYTGLVGRKPTARFLIENQYKIPKDSIAAVGMAGLLGNNLIAIKMGESNDTLEPSTEIKTQVGFDINHVVNEIGELTQSVGGAFNKIEKMLGSQEDGEENIIEQISQMIRENQENLKKSVANIETITGQMAKGEGTLGKLIMDDDLYEELQTVADQLKGALSEGSALLTDARDVVAHVKSGEGTLGGLIYGEKNLAAEVEVLIANLTEFSEKLNNPDSTVGKLLTDDDLYGELQGIMRKANQTLDGMGDTAPISAIGAVAAPLF